MAGHAVVNLKRDPEDQAPAFGVSPDFEIRFGREPLGCENCGVSYMRLAPNWRQPFGHAHKVQEEIYVLVNGSARVKVDDDIHDLDLWSAVRIGPGSIRSLEAGPEGAEFVAIGAPNTGPGDGEAT